MKYTFISVPALGDKQNTFLNIKGKLAEYAQTNKFVIPEFKVNRDEIKNIMFNLRVMLQIGTLDALVLLSDELVKFDAVAEQSVNKLVDMLSTLLKGEQGNIQDHLLVNESKVLLSG